MSFYPDLSFRYRHPDRTSPLQPQNLPRPTWKGMEGLGCAACDAKRPSGVGRAVQGVLGLRGLGELYEAGRIPLPVMIAWSVLSTAGAATGAYHGYKRNNSLGWAVAWFFMGGWFPLITIPVSLAQGYAKRA